MTIACFRYKNTEDSIYILLLFLAPVIVFGITHAVCDFINEMRDKDDDSDYRRNTSLIVAGIFSAINLVLYLILYIATKQTVYLGFMALGVVVSFTFISQFAWGGVIKTIFTAGGFTFKMPGFIFSLDIDSILWMIVVKFFLGILAAILFVVTTILLALLAILGSVFTFIPSVIIKTAKDKKA